MWSWIVCYVMGHDYTVSCNKGAMFLKCIACGTRSNGWTVRGHEPVDARPRQPHQGIVAGRVGA